MPADVFTIGPYTVPGALRRVEVPDRELVWQVTQGALGGVGAATIWRGVKVTEGIVVTTLLTDPADPTRAVQDADEAARIWGAFLDLVHPQSLQKPPAWDVGHPLLDAQRPRVQRCSHSKNKLVPLNDSGLAWLGSIVLIEFKKLQPRTPAAPDPAKLDGVEPPQTAAQKRIEELTNKVING